MSRPEVSHAFLAAQVRWAMGRGLPAQAAEDVVFEAYESAVVSYRPLRGAFEPYMQKIVRNATAYWWRVQGRTERAYRGLALVTEPSDTAEQEAAERRQQALIDALSDEQRQVFAAWALQKHLGKGKVRAGDVAASIGMQPTEFENAKRRLRAAFTRLAEQFGWSVAQIVRGEDDGAA